MSGVYAISTNDGQRHYFELNATEMVGQRYRATRASVRLALLTIRHYATWLRVTEGSSSSPNEFMVEQEGSLFNRSLHIGCMVFKGRHRRALIKWALSK